MAKQPSIFIDGIELRLVPRQSTNGSLFYVSGNLANVVGYKLYPDGRLIKANATPTTSANCKRKSNANRKQRYLQFKDVFGFHKNIYASHAVCLAWNGPRPTEPDGRPFQCHHFNGITSDNRHTNLIWLSHHDHLIYDRALRTRRLLAHGLVEFTYIKHDGTVRTARGTNNPELVPPSKAPTGRQQRDIEAGLAQPNYRSIPYYDLDKEAWRAFSIENFLHVTRVMAITPIEC